MPASTNKQEVQKKLDQGIQSLREHIERVELVEKYQGEIDDIITKAICEGSPDLYIPEEELSLLSRVYSKCRADGGDSEMCSKIARSAATKAGYKSSVRSLLNKAYGQLSGIVQKQKEAMETIQQARTEPTKNYLTELNYQCNLMSFPTNISNDNPNNPWMNQPENQQPIDYQKAYTQWMELYSVMCSGSVVYILPSVEGLQDETYVANIGIALPNTGNTIILSNYRSEPRIGEEAIGRQFFNMMQFNVTQPQTFFEGEADLKYIREKILVGGYGIRSDETTYDWIMEQTGSQIIKVKMTDQALYHFDTLFFPVDNFNALVCTEAISPEDIKQIEGVVNIIDVPKSFAYEGATNCVRLGNLILNGSTITALAKEDTKYSIEADRVEFMSRVLGPLGFEPMFINLSEFEKSGASLSCMVMHLNYFDYNKKKE